MPIEIGPNLMNVIMFIAAIVMIVIAVVGVRHLDD